MLELWYQSIFIYYFTEHCCIQKWTFPQRWKRNICRPIQLPGEGRQGFRMTDERAGREVLSRHQTQYMQSRSVKTKQTTLPKTILLAHFCRGWLGWRDQNCELAWYFYLLYNSHQKKKKTQNDRNENKNYTVGRNSIGTRNCWISCFKKYNNGDYGENIKSKKFMSTARGRWIRGRWIYDKGIWDEPLICKQVHPGTPRIRSPQRYR